MRLSVCAGALLSGCVSRSGPEFFGSENYVNYPPALNVGDTICCVSPATVIQDSAVLETARATLESHGFNVVMGKHVLDRNGYLAGTDQHRAQDINNAFADAQVHAIFALRGGWGSNRILPYLDFDTVRHHPKIFMGFSDVTTLLNAFYHRSGLVTFHGPVGFSPWNDYHRSYIYPLMLAGQKLVYRNEDRYGPLAVTGDNVIRTISPGVAEGRLVGGNMSVWLSLTGTDYLPDVRGKILFFEDVNEPLYRIDRYLSTLKLNGTLEKIAGIIFGHFRKPRSEQGRKVAAGDFTLADVIAEYIRPLNIPCYMGAQIGHIRHSQVWPVGGRVRMNASEGTLRLLEAAVTV